jgi:hypothetical protein
MARMNLEKVWGSKHPTQLVRLFEYLNSKGYLGPSVTSTAHNLHFRREIDSDLSVFCTIVRVYEDPQGVFNFQSYLGLSSVRVANIAREIGILAPSATQEYDGAICVFSVGLQYLKWNAVGGSENPVWQISGQPEFVDSASQWIADWEAFGSPIVDPVASSDSAAQASSYALAYRAQSWVKSDGFSSISLPLFAATIMWIAGQRHEATEIIQQVRTKSGSRDSVLAERLSLKLQALC